MEINNILQPSEKLKLGGEITINEGESVLFGRGESAVGGSKVVQIDDIKNNMAISNFALKIAKQDGKITVSMPVLHIGQGEYYRSKNDIVVTDTRGNPKLVDGVYDGGNGLNIDKIIVVDNAKGHNGFVLQMTGSDTMRLVRVVNNGHKTDFVAKK
jgi:hypothetical protein